MRVNTFYYQDFEIEAEFLYERKVVNSLAKQVQDKVVNQDIFALVPYSIQKMVIKDKNGATIENNQFYESLILELGRGNPDYWMKFEKAEWK